MMRRTLARRALLCLLTLPMLAGQARAQSPDTARAVSDTDPVIKDEVVNEGRKIFHGPGTCFACHGARLQGGPVAPPLVAHEWKTGDGSFEMILHTVRGGVPGTVMVAHPGGISDAQTIQVATYVWAVSHGKAVP
jgi:mono/diheme cytochrome c family protein